MPAFTGMIEKDARRVGFGQCCHGHSAMTNLILQICVTNGECKEQKYGRSYKSVCKQN